MVRSLCLAAALFAVATAAQADNQSSNTNSAEERACRGDAHRFCHEAIGDEFRVASCLIEHRDRISHACRAVLESHGM